MPPKCPDKWLLGKPRSVLQDEFENSLMLGDMETMMTRLPFNGPQRLPTSEQVLKLYFVLRGLDKYARSPVQDVSELVSKLIIKYWAMANITTVDIRSVKIKVGKLVGQYGKLVKLKAKQNAAQVKERQDFVTKISKLFDIASAEAEKEMVKNRLLGIKDKEEDLKFLEDQRGPRAGSIGVRDQNFDKAVQRKEVREETEGR